MQDSFEPEAILRQVGHLKQQVFMRMRSYNMYKQCLTSNGEVAKVVVRTLDGAAIPFDPANRDYQTYLKWLSEGNEPLPADQPTEG
jgi:hypothetical protein